MFVCGEWRNAGVEWMSRWDAAQTSDEHTSLLCLKTSEESSPALPGAARRIRRNVRQSDSVLLLENVCIVLLPATPLLGAEAAARRISMLVADVEFELQVLYGAAALTLFQRLQSEGATVVGSEETLLDGLGSHPGTVTGVRSIAPNKKVGSKKIRFIRPLADNAPPEAPQNVPIMPYLAFLSNYPSRRLLHLFPYELACRYQCIPVGAERDMLTLGTSQWLEYEVVSHFEEVTRRGIFQVRCEASMIDDVLRYWERVQGIETRDDLGIHPCNYADEA